MIKPEQEEKYKECLKVLDEVQEVLAASIAIDETVAQLPALTLVQEAINGIIMLSQLNEQEQISLIEKINNSKESTKKVVSTTKQGKVVIH